MIRLKGCYTILTALATYEYWCLIGYMVQLPEAKNKKNRNLSNNNILTKSRKKNPNMTNS